MTETDAPTNPYIALREAKIARNEARLAKLGLLKPSVALRQSPEQKKNTNRRSDVPKPVQEPTRRSSRLSQQSSQPDYKEVSMTSSEGPQKRRRIVSTSFDVADEVIEDSSASSTPKNAAPPANSVRSIDIDVDELVTGENELLGRFMHQSGKEYVINKTFELASSTQDQQRLSGTKLSFNKYCGVQEWNNAIFLWINLGSKDNTVVNDFLDGGSRITWFGGSRMHDNSPVIHKLLKLGKQATLSTSKIVLWVRKYDTGLKKFTPYICLGRLSYHSHQPGSHPLAFVWNLIDADLLKNHSDLSVKEQYDSLITL
jgi:hypothetical protein